MFAPIRIGFKELEKMESQKRKSNESDESSSSADGQKIQKLDIGPLTPVSEMDEILGSENKSLTESPPNTASENNTATKTLEDPKYGEQESKILHLEETNRILQQKVLDLESKLVEQTGTVCHITGSRDEYAMKLSDANGRLIQVSKLLYEREGQLRNLKDRQEKFVKEIANNTAKLATKYNMIEPKKPAPETTYQPIILAQRQHGQQQQAQNQYQQNYQPSVQRINGVDVFPIPPGGGGGNNNNANFHQPPSFLNRGNIQNPEVSNAATQPGMQQVQIVRSGDGKIYVHGLHQGQQMMHMPNGKLQIFTPSPSSQAVPAQGPAQPQTLGTPMGHQHGIGVAIVGMSDLPHHILNQVRDGPKKRSSKKKPTIISSNSNSLSPKMMTTEENHQKILNENRSEPEADDDVA